MKTNIIYNKSSAKMEEIEDNSIDLTITSPPYDKLRTYGGYKFDFELIAKELYRVTKKGGVVAWIVGDATIKGSETGTSFKQALYFKEIGFNLHDTMVWFKINAMPQVDKTRFTQSFEYMFILSKGKPKTANPIMIKTKSGGKFSKRGDGNKQNINKAGGNIVADRRIGFNVYSLCVGQTNYGHPAIFPKQLANDHILSWSNENDIILDPMAGSGTTLKMAKRNNRRYIGYEINKKYCDIAEQRLETEKTLWD